TVVGDLLSENQDIADDHTYALVAGDGDGDNTRFKVLDQQLLTDAQVNFDSSATFEIRLRSTDTAGASFEKAFVLVNDDVDGDGMSDAFELAHFGNLLATPEGDGDADGLSNLDEFLNGTNPNISDTDGDGVLDAVEVALGTDPTNSADAPAVLDVSPATASVGREEGVITLRVRNTGLAVLNWQAEVASGDFVEILSGQTGVNSGEINIVLATNLSSAVRLATVRVTADNAVGSPADIALNQSACSAPGIPSDVLATNGTLPGQVRVLWNNVEDADEYMVYRSLGTDPNGADLIAMVVGTAFTDATAAVLPTAKQADDTGGGCVPLIAPGPGTDETSYQYWVRASNICGTSNFSDPDDGFPGAGPAPALALFEPVLPALEADNRSLRARVDSVLAIRLKRDSAIDPNSIRGEVTRSSGGTSTTIEWRAIDTEGLRDGWALYRPGDDLFNLGETVEFTVSASTVVGETIGPLTYRFAIETERDFLDRIGAGEVPIGQPAYTDFDASGIDLSLESQEEVLVYAIDDTRVPGSLANATGLAYAIVPDALYDVGQRVWLPLADDMRADDVVVNYYFADKTGSSTGWHAAGQIEGWSDESSYLELELDGARYIGFTVQHGALVQLSMAAAKDIPVSDASALPAFVLRFGGDGIIVLLLIFGLIAILPRFIGLRGAR
ncbi:MAG: hypothetical protein L3K26_11085, partial [Candidatus Hydrogenedentes bacterium]|nr:hypothetical protein [Candidatus Hydrogenedentota bacterium]